MNYQVTVTLFYFLRKILKQNKLLSQFFKYPHY